MTLVEVDMAVPFPNGVEGSVEHFVWDGNDKWARVRLADDRVAWLRTTTIQELRRVRDEVLEKALGE